MYIYICSKNYKKYEKNRWWMEGGGAGIFTISIFYLKNRPKIRKPYIPICYVYMKNVVLFLYFGVTS